ncbi:MAG: cell wall-binding repeat-containing protein, partial [Coriobacteriia bacterium]|nr:cell wall-binding repeat-containing protein [Coriobacteriia bacterium]
SDYGPGVNDLCAPGSLFWTADQPGWDADGSGAAAIPGYQFWYGTSFSSPAAAGAIAYLWRAEPDLTNDQIVSYVESSSVDLGTPGRDDMYGYGMVDMQAAYNKLIADYPMLAKPTISAATYMRSGQNVSWTSSTGYNVNYVVSIDGTPQSTQTSTTYTLPSLTDGQHLVSVLPTSTRNWDTSSLATKTIIYDGTAPVVSGFAYNGTTLSWSVTEANPYTVQAYVDTATPAAAPSNTLVPVGLHSGTHTLHVNATDGAGNSSGWVTWDFVAVAAPDAPVVPSVVVTDALSANVSWAPVPTATSYDYSINGGVTQSTSATGFPISPLNAGVTSVAVRSRASTLTSSWTSATVTNNVVVPGTPVPSAPATVGVASATVSWPAAPNALSYEYRLNGGSSTPTTALSATITGLVPGVNSLSVRSLDNLAHSAWATATVSYVLPTFRIVPTAGAGGTITPGATQTVTVGGSATFSVESNTGYHLVDVLKDGVSIGASTSVTFSAVQADHTLSATFAIDTFTLAPSAGAHGQISPSATQTVNYGTNTTFTITPDPGYHVAAVLVDGASVGAATSHTFSDVSANHTISATFAINTYSIVPSAGVGGTISPSTAETADYGSDSSTFTITPNANYHIVDVSVDGSSVGTVTVYQFTDVTANHTIGATFAADAGAKGIGRLSGATRYATAVAIAKDAFPGWSGVRNLVLASGENNHQPDALTAAGLAGVYNCPLLLVPTNYLDPNTKAAIASMPKGVAVHIVGGSSAISAKVRNLIARISRVKSVDRSSGADRYATSAAVALKMKSVLGASRMPRKVLLTNGASAALLLDPLIASTVSNYMHFPVLLLKSNQVPSATRSALASLRPVAAYIVGSTGAVSESVRTSLKIPSGNRIFGADVQGDATAFATRARAQGWLVGTTVGFAAAVPDAATGGAYMGRRSGPMLLVLPSSIPQTTQDYLTNNKATISGGWVFGDANAILESVRAQLAGLIN